LDAAATCGTIPPVSDLERRVAELTALNTTLRALTATLDVPEILRIVLDHIKRVTSAEGLSLLLHDPDRNELVFAATETLQENSLISREQPLPPAVGGLMSPDLLIVPVHGADRVLGMIHLTRRYDGSRFERADRDRLAAFATALAGSGELERLARDPEVLHAVFARLATVVPSEDASLVLYDAELRELAFRVSRALKHGVIDGMRIQLGQGIVGWVAAQRTALRLDDASRDPRHDPHIARVTGLVPHSMICVPMVYDGRLHGVIQVINRLDGSRFDEDELRLVQTLADHAAVAIDRALLYRQAEQAALTDDVTGLGNTRHFTEVLPALLERGGPLSLLILDLDGLRGVVERDGYQAGTLALAAVGRVIGSRLRPGDVAARFGGDEFAVILPATDVAAARGLADALRQAIADSRVELTASVGVATFPDHASDAESLFRAAETAMTRVKRGSGNGVGVGG
jgi:diguanylate cyclase (GGDEF)-like protein